MEWQKSSGKTRCITSAGAKACFAGNDGHRTFSVSAVVSPYVSTMTAVYSWYPERYGSKDAFRMGNYTLLWNVAQNIATEFIYGGPHSLLSRFHLAPSIGPTNN
jgi:hypothetical protein